MASELQNSKFSLKQNNIDGLVLAAQISQHPINQNNMFKGVKAAQINLPFSNTPVKQIDFMSVIYHCYFQS